MHEPATRACVDRLTVTGGPQSDRDPAALQDLVDARLVHRFQAGDPEAYILLHDRYRARVLAVARRRLHCPQDAEDVVQQVWLKVFEALQAYRLGRGSFAAWLVKVAQNSAEDYSRTQRRADRWAPGDIDRERDRGLDDRPEWGRATEIHAALAELAPAQRDVLVLLYRWDLGYERTADALGRSEATVRQLHNRATASLRKRLAPG